MADEERKPLEAPVAVWVRGGTTSSEHDRMVQAQLHDDERRRQQQDAMMRAPVDGVLPAHLRSEDIAGTAPGDAQVASMRLGGNAAAGYASIVLGLRHPKDQQILDWIICELIVNGDELILNLACPRCAASGEPDRVRDQNIKIHQSNRMFWLDTKRQGEIWVNPRNPDEHYVLAGTVTTRDWITCPNRGCGWRFRIDDSIVYTDR